MTVDQMASPGLALNEFLDEFADCFGRCELRRNLAKHVRGQLSELPPGGPDNPKGCPGVSNSTSSTRATPLYC